MAVDLEMLVEFLDSYLQIDAIREASLNGLQIEGKDTVERLAVAVDAAGATIDDAVQSGCQMLLVHHGLFWDRSVPLTGTMGRRTRACFAADLSVYAAHLPLDVHPEVGNNALLVRCLGAEVEGSFGPHQGVDIGLIARLPEPRPLAEIGGELAADGCDQPLIWCFGKEEVQRLAVVTGSGCSLLEDAVAAAADCLITGEPKHSAYHSALEAGMNCIFAGHYRTERAGVWALARRLASKYDIEVQWIEHPTGL